MNFYLINAENAGCIITAEGNKLKLHNHSVLNNEQIEVLKRNKQSILENLKQQQEASKNGWIVYPNGVAFEKQVSKNSIVFVFREKDGTFTVWRGTWKNSSLPHTEKIIISKVDFDEALKRGNNYANWFRKNVGVRR